MDLESCLRFIRLGQRSHVILHPNAIYKKASRLPLKWDGKRRKKFLSDCRHLGTLTLPKVLSVLRTFTEFHKLEDVVGYRKYGHTVHYVADYPRMKHILGLSDAVDQAMINFNLKVCFPCTKTFPVLQYDKPLRASRTFSKISFREGYPQLVVRAVRKSCTSKRRRFDLILHYLRVFPKGLAEKDYVKLIKLSLAGTFSGQMDQDLPEGFPEKSIPLFPAFTQDKLDKLLKGDSRKERRVSFYFNLLQSKALCAPVDSEMIKDAYEKHCQSLCRPEEDTIPKDPYLYERLRDHARKFFSECCHYDPYRTSLPNTMSSIEKNRREGGNRKGLVANGTLRRSNRHPLIGMMENTSNARMEPYVIGLFGQPASGKSTIVQRLVSELKQFIAPSLSREDFIYSRSCSTSHWDGYHGQPVVILDDFGQNLEDRTDLAEFMTLVSVNDYVLPMADLADKGQKFRSPIVVVTSNMGFGSPNVRNPAQGVILEDTTALWRRFDLPLLVEKTKVGFFPKVTPYKLGSYRPTGQFYEKKHASSSDTHWTSCHPLDGRGPPVNISHKEYRSLSLPISSFGELAKRVLTGVEKKFDFHQRTFHDSWTQWVHSFKVDYRKTSEGPLWDPLIEEVNPGIMDHCDSISLDFPISPPKCQPRVKAHAIPEPLKVRMITLGEVDTKVLQPFQKALWAGLGKRPQFCLTNGVKDLEDFAEETLPWIYRIEKVIQRILEKGDILEDDPVWLSGDYTAATDNFPMWATEALLEGLLDCIDHEPTKRWARWEVSSHLIDYPGCSGVQTSGQLMGSLLSFPLLCLLNDFVMQESGFDPKTYLVNGDDVVARSSRAKIDTWKGLAPRVGLSLSLGKNFIDPDFCTVNSQLFYQGRVRHTGKVALARRWGTTIDYCYSEAQFYWGATPELMENFLSRNWKELSLTPRSLHYSKEHGGLGLVDVRSSHGLKVDQRLAKEVYLYDAISRFGKVHRVPNAPFSFVAFPLIRGEASREGEGKHPSVNLFNRFLSLGALENEPLEKFADLTHKTFTSWKSNF